MTFYYQLKSIKSSLTLIAAHLLVLNLFITAAQAQNPTADENKKPGARDWQLTRVRLNDTHGFRSPWIEGYCDKQSVKAGEKLKIMVSTAPASPFEIEIFRMGYYGGKGSRLMQKLGPFEGKPQATPKPGKKNIHECTWEPSTEITIPADWKAASISVGCQ